MENSKASERLFATIKGTAMTPLDVSMKVDSTDGRVSYDGRETIRLKLAIWPKAEAKYAL